MNRLLREGEIVDDDLIRGACPGQVAIPWLPSLDPRGLFLNIMVESVQAVESLRPLIGM
jgi:hypothetical protein